MRATQPIIIAAARAADFQSIPFPQTDIEPVGTEATIEGGGKRGVLDLAAGDLEALCQSPQIEIRARLRFGRKHSGPDLQPMCLEFEPQTPEEVL